MCWSRGSRSCRGGPSSSGCTTSAGARACRSPRGRPSPTPSRDDYVHAIGAVASRDGKYLYYTKRNKLFNAYNNLNFPLSQVARRDRATGDEDTITDARGSGFRPAISPDGTKLVYGTRVDNQTGLRIRDLASGEERWLKLPVQRDEQESRYTRDLIPGYAFTPDGKYRAGGLRRQDPPARRPDRRGPGDPVSARVSQPVGSRLNFPDARGRRPGEGAVDPGAGAVARRQAAGVLGTDEALRDGPARGQAQAALGRRCPRVSPELVARRQVAGLRELGARGRPHLEAGRRRPGRAGTAHARCRFLPRPGLDAGRQAGRGPARPAANAGREPVTAPVPVLDLVWVPAEGGDATVISPARARAGPTSPGKPTGST